MPLEIRQLIRDMSLANPLWGAPRIHGELLKLGIDIGQTSVAKYMMRRRGPPLETSTEAAKRRLHHNVAIALDRPGSYTVTHSEMQAMPKPKFPYTGDAPLKRLLERYRCPAPFHVVRMRFWGEIVSPSLQASPIKTIESFWPNGLPTFRDGAETNAFFQALMSLWSNVARFQDGSPPLKLQKVDKIDTREALHAAAKLRVEELLDGFMYGFTGGSQQIDVPPGVGDLLSGVEKSIELLATTRNTFAKPPGPEDAAILAELGGIFPQVDRAVQADLNAIAVAVKNWRKNRLHALRSHPTTPGSFH